MSKAIQDFLDRHCLNTDAISMDDLCSRFIDAMHDGLSGNSGESVTFYGKEVFCAVSTPCTATGQACTATPGGFMCVFQSKKGGILQCQ